MEVRFSLHENYLQNLGCMSPSRTAEKYYCFDFLFAFLYIYLRRYCFLIPMTEPCSIMFYCDV